jgi:HSP20 family protein
LWRNLLDSQETLIILYPEGETQAALDGQGGLKMAIGKFLSPKNVTPVRSLRNEVDRLFDDFMLGFDPFGRGIIERPAGWVAEMTEKGMAMPAVDLSETDTGFMVKAEMPGISKDHVTISVREDSITIRGEQKEEKEKKEERYHLRETYQGYFERTLPLPGMVEASKATAKMEDGVLVVMLPKKPEAISKGVELKVN